MKKCSKCGEQKDENLFGKDKRLKSGLRGECKECHYKVCNNWKERNPGKVKEYLKKSYENHRDDILYKQKIRDKNRSFEEKERKREYCREYYRQTKEKQAEIRSKKRVSRTEEELDRDYLRQREYYENNKEQIQSRARERYNNLSQKQKQQNTARTKEWRQRNSEKTKAWSAVGNALFKGELEKPPYCELCGVFDVKIHAHHEDYSQPLDVLWLCHDCHMSLHADKRVDELT